MSGIHQYKQHRSDSISSASSSPSSSSSSPSERSPSRSKSCDRRTVDDAYDDRQFTSSHHDHHHHPHHHQHHDRERIEAMERLERDHQARERQHREDAAQTGYHGSLSLSSSSSSPSNRMYPPPPSPHDGRSPRYAAARQVSHHHNMTNNGQSIKLPTYDMPKKTSSTRLLTGNHEPVIKGNNKSATVSSSQSCEISTSVTVSPSSSMPEAASTQVPVSTSHQSIDTSVACDNASNGNNDSSSSSSMQQQEEVLSSNDADTSVLTVEEDVEDIEEATLLVDDEATTSSSYTDTNDSTSTKNESKVESKSLEASPEITSSYLADVLDAIAKVSTITSTSTDSTATNDQKTNGQNVLSCIDMNDDKNDDSYYDELPAEACLSVDVNGTHDNSSQNDSVTAIQPSDTSSATAQYRGPVGNGGSRRRSIPSLPSPVPVMVPSIAPISPLSMMLPRASKSNASFHAVRGFDGFIFECNTSTFDESMRLELFAGIHTYSTIFPLCLALRLMILMLI
jgi:hypothetical protein